MPWPQATEEVHRSVREHSVDSPEEDPQRGSIRTKRAKVALKMKAIHMYPEQKDFP